MSSHTAHITQVNLRRVAAVACFMLAATGGVAQNNVLKINDELYEIYWKARDNRTKPEGLALAKEMYKRAEELGDKKGIVLAMFGVVLHSSYPANYKADEFNRALNKLRELAEKYGYWQYYYEGTNNQLKVLLLHNQTKEAIQCAKQHLQFAKSHNHRLGILYSYTQIGHIRRHVGEYSAAAGSYRQALDYGTLYCPDMDMGFCYVNLCICAELLYDYASMRYYAENGLKVCRTAANNAKLRGYRCFADFAQDRYDDFMREYKQLPKDANGFLNNQDSRINIILNSFYSVLTKGDIKLIERKVKAENLGPHSEASALYWCYKYLGMYKDAYRILNERFQDHITASHITGYDNVANTDVSLRSMVYSMDKEDEELKNAKLSLAYSNLKLTQSKLEREKAVQAESIARLNAENFNLNYQGKQYEALQLSDSLNILKTQQATREQKHRSHRIIMGLIIATIIIILSVIAYAARRIRSYSSLMQTTNTRLNKKNKQLVAEQEKAQKANESKTMFIHNMTHDIHSPLRDLVSAAALLSSKDCPSDPTQKKELGNTINAKTAELLALIDSTLKKTKDSDLTGDAELSGGL